MWFWSVKKSVQNLFGIVKKGNPAIFEKLNIHCQRLYFYPYNACIFATNALVPGRYFCKFALV